MIELDNLKRGEEDYMKEVILEILSALCMIIGTLLFTFITINF